MEGGALSIFFVFRLFKPIVIRFCLCLCSYGNVHCKHQLALAFLAAFIRENIQNRPPWAKIRARVQLSQVERVLLGRNLSWTDFLATILEDIPVGQRFKVEPLTIPAPAAAAVVVPAPLRPPARAKRAAAVSRAKKHPKVVESSSEEEESILERPSKRRRLLTVPETDAKYRELVALAQDESDSTIKKWVQNNYPQFVRSITYTGKQQTLYTLAALLTDL